MQKQKQATLKDSAKAKAGFNASIELKTAASKGKKILKAKSKIKMPKVLPPKSGMTYEFKKGIVEALYSGKYYKIQGALSNGGNHVCVMGAIGHELAKTRGTTYRNLGSILGGYAGYAGYMGREQAIGAAVGISAAEVDKLVKENDYSKGGKDGFKALADHINKNL